MRFLFLVLLSGLINASASASDVPAFLVPGSVLDEDIGDLQKVHGTWLAVHEKNDRWYLSKTKVSTTKTTESDPTVDVRAEQEGAIGLLRDKSLEPGELEPAVLIKDSYGVSHAFVFKGKKYSLIVKPVKFKYHSQELGKTSESIRNEVYFSDGNRSERVYGGAKTYQSCDHPQIKWAGDIDRDGKPDAIVHFDDDGQKNALTCVFLSGKARDGQLVGKFGCQSFSG